MNVLHGQLQQWLSCLRVNLRAQRIRPPEAKGLSSVSLYMSKSRSAQRINSFHICCSSADFLGSYYITSGHR